MINKTFKKFAKDNQFGKDELYGYEDVKKAYEAGWEDCESEILKLDEQCFDPDSIYDEDNGPVEFGSGSGYLG